MFVFLVVVAVVAGSLAERGVTGSEGRWRILVPLLVFALGVAMSAVSGAQDAGVLAFAFAVGFAAGWARTAATSVHRDRHA